MNRKSTSPLVQAQRNAVSRKASGPSETAIARLREKDKEFIAKNKGILVGYMIRISFSPKDDIPRNNGRYRGVLEFIERRIPRARKDNTLISWEILADDLLNEAISTYANPKKPRIVDNDTPRDEDGNFMRAEPS